MDGTTSLIELKGIGEKTAAAFARLGVRNVDSLDSTEYSTESVQEDILYIAA